MNKLTRRTFITRSAAVGLALSGLPRLSLADEKKKDEKLDMTIVRAAADAAEAKDGKSLAARLTEKAIAEIGGMTRFVSKGDVVWVKPNIGWNRPVELAANTHPDVVSALVRMCFDAGAKAVKVGDYPCHNPKQTYVNSGIGPAAEAVGAEIVYLNKRKFREMKIAGERLKDHPVYPDMVECDLMINVPVCKHHGSTTVTLAMKNYMGCVDDRGTFHQDLPTTIADMTRFMKPQISVLDATRILLRNGPTGGDPKDVQTKNTVAASVDIVALDAFGSELLGHKPTDIETVVAGEKYKLGKMDYKSLKLKEFSLS